MFLVDVAEMAERLIEDHLAGTGWRFEFDNARRRMGCCRYRSKRITMSRILCRKATESEVHDTILHEIAHALVGPGYGHGPVWKRAAMDIGCTAERCHRLDTSTGAKWRGVCGQCGKVFNYHRKPKYNPQTAYSCGKCKVKIVMEKVR